MDPLNLSCRIRIAASNRSRQETRPHRLLHDLHIRHPSFKHSPLLLWTLFLRICRHDVVDNKVCGLNGSARCVLALTNLPSLQANNTTVKPTTALMPFRTGSVAYLSSSSS